MIIILGRRDCNECGGEGTVRLIINRDGIWSQCERCKFLEWEWTWGDDPDYLSYLARTFNVDLERLENALERVAEGL